MLLHPKSLVPLVTTPPDQGQGLLRSASSEGSVRARVLLRRLLGAGGGEARAWNPKRRISRAELWSRSSSAPQEGQLCQRSSRSLGTITPHWLQRWLVFLGFTLRTRAPALSALPSQILTNCPHPASRMLLFRPALRLAPLGRYCPVSASCFALGRRLMLAGLRSSKQRKAYRLTS